MKTLFSERYYGAQLVVIWLIVSTLLLIASWVRIQEMQMGADDHLRLIQARDWIAGQNWWDISQYRMNSPVGGAMHWSRLVDVPLGLLLLLFRPLLGQAGTEQVAVVIVPLITLGVVIWLMAGIARRLFGHKEALIAGITTFTMLPIVEQLSPTRIDHHGWQIVLFLICLRSVVEQQKNIFFAITLGIALSLWIEISIEGLPFVAIFLGLIALRWIFPNIGSEKAGQKTQFPVAIMTTAVGSAILYIGTEGFQFSENMCDSLSPVHVVFLFVIAIIVNLAVVSASLFKVNLGIISKLALSVFAASGAMAVIIAIAPQCAGDAFGNLDPLVREYWYDRTAEGLPLWHLPFRYAVQPLAAIMASLVGLAYLFMRDKHTSNRSKIDILLLLLASCLIGLFVNRAFVYTLCITGIILAPVIVALFRNSEKNPSLSGRMAMRLFPIILIAPTIFGQITYDVMKKSFTESRSAKTADGGFDYDFAYACQQSSNIVRLDILPPAQLMAGLDVSPSILHFTSHKVVATGHHRNQQAMKDVIIAFTGNPQTVRQIFQKRKIDFLITCAGSPELLFYLQHSPAGFWAKLKGGDTPNWLVVQPSIGPYKIWRVELGK